MCTGLEIAMLAAAAYSTYSTIEQGQEQKKMHKFQAAQATADAQSEREAGQVRAERIRRAAAGTRSEATAALAASGVEVGAGTPLRIDEEILRSSEEDAMNEVLYGERKGGRLDQQSQLQGMAGYNAQRSSLLAAGGTAMSGWASIAKGRRGVYPEQGRAPVSEGVVSIG